MEERRVALLVDGENLSADHAGFLIKTSVNLGVLSVRRVFGAVTRLGDWTSAPGFRVVHVPQIKNSADIALSLDALELALTGQVDEIVLATSDRDMTLVAMRLAELGMPVTGIGEEKSAVDFRKSCRKFVQIPGKPQAVAEIKPPEFEARLRKFMTAEADSAGWVTFSALGSSRARDARISKTDAGIGKAVSWSDWFKRHPEFYEIEERGTQSRARLKSSKKP